MTRRSKATPLEEHERGHIAILRREAQVAYTRLTVAKAETIEDLFGQEKKRILRTGDFADRG